MKNNLVSLIFFAIILSVISAYAGFLWDGQASEYIFLASSLFFFGILSRLLYDFFNLDQLRLILSAINAFIILTLAIYSLSSTYFLIPLAILLIPYFSGRKSFFSINFWSNISASIAFLYVVIEIIHTTLIDVYLYLVITFNALLSLASYVVKSYNILEKQTTSKQHYFEKLLGFSRPEKSKNFLCFELKTPRYYIIIMLLIPLFLIIGGLIVFNQEPLAILSIFAGIALLVLFSYSFNDFIIDKNKLIVKKSLFPLEKIINIKNIQKAVVKNVAGIYYTQTNILELHFKDCIKKFDIRTNYDAKNTAKFLSVLKNILGKKYFK